MAADPRARFRALHERVQVFVMPNPWDVGSAKLLASMGFEALATTSAGLAWSLGKLDMQVTRDELVAHVERLAEATSLPLNVDSERCFPDGPGGVAETVRLLAERRRGGLLDRGLRPGDGRDRGARGRGGARGGCGVRAARCSPLAPRTISTASTISKTRSPRLVAYREAGADVVYAPGLADLGSISRLVDEVGVPVNVLALPNGPTVAELGGAGVRRVSTGGALARFAYGAHAAGSGGAARRRHVPLQRGRRTRRGAQSGARGRLDFGPVSTETERELWGGETRKAVANFPVSGEPIPVPVARWLGRIKAAAARANAELGLLDADKAERIAAAGDAIAQGEHDGQFPIDVFQTGSGTSSNMNANEVIASLAGEDVHANDDVNMGQSSNDVFPSAVHLAALGELEHDLLPALETLAASLEAKAKAFDDVVKSGRTHLMDAVPVTLGQEFGGYAAQVREGIERVRDSRKRLGQIPLGGTAVGTGLNTHPDFAAKVRELLADDTGLHISPPADPFESQAARDGLVEASGALKVVAVSLTKIANDLRLMGSGPRAGLSELFLPELQKGSSIMPGKVNPVIPEVVTQVAAQVIGNDQAITVGGLQGHFELNVFIPMMARNLLGSIKLLASASRLLAEKCVDGIEANREQNEHYAELTLSAATALNPYIGYDKASEIVKKAAASGRSLRDVAQEEGVDGATLDEALDYRKMARPHD